jgi:hypothetical protein
MRSAPLAAFVLLLVLGTSLLAQNAPQRGKIKSSDPAKGTVTVTVDGKDQEFAITGQTMLRDADNQPITNFKEKGVPAGTNVMVRIERRGDQMVLTGMKVVGAATGKQAGGRPAANPPPPPRDSIGVRPLTELGTEMYKGQTGGLYGEGKNEPPAKHAEAARRELAKIQPLDPQGKPAATGKIGLLSIGMSNTTQEFSLFKTLSDRDSKRASQVAVIDGAQGGKASEQWIDPQSEVGSQVWGTVESRLKAGDVTPEQVQVVWIKQALIQQGRFGEFPDHAKKLESDLVKILQVAKQRFPNLRVAYLSSRIYAGFATTPLNPEPYAYEGAFSVRWVIQSQIDGDAKLNYDAARGPVTAPLVLWGPYLWGDGTTPRKDNGLVWKREDLRGEDGTHPSELGRKKVADMLINFFHSDPLAKTWYLASSTKDSAK